MNSLRLTIAKWIAPELEEQFEYLRDGIKLARESRGKWMRRGINYNAALSRIAALRTPNASHGVKKACAIAEAALSGENK